MSLHGAKPKAIAIRAAIFSSEFSVFVNIVAMICAKFTDIQGEADSHLM